MEAGEGLNVNNTASGADTHDTMQETTLVGVSFNFAFVYI